MQTKSVLMQGLIVVLALVLATSATAEATMGRTAVFELYSPETAILQSFVSQNGGNKDTVAIFSRFPVTSPLGCSQAIVITMLTASGTVKEAGPTEAGPAAALSYAPASDAAWEKDPAAEARAGFNFTPAELDLFARLVHAEAGGEPYAGQVAVAATVLNRLRSSLYPNTLAGVIYQISGGRYQYSPVLDGRINNPAGQSARKAVEDAMAGWDPSLGALGFFNPRKTANFWVRTRPVTITIGQHVFFK